MRLLGMNLKSKTVFLRLDLNVPVIKGAIVNDYRLLQIKPTLDYLVKHDARIIIGTHIGRPSTGPKISTSILLEWFEQHGYRINFCKNLESAPLECHKLIDGEMLLLENLRFFPGEQSHDAQEKLEFAHSLRQLGDYYINDAFALMHRQDTSITTLPSLYKKEHKSIGFLTEGEIKHLEPTRNQPKKPYVIILGGGKVADKLPILELFLSKATSILVCPAISFTFMAAQGTEVGKSLIDSSAYGIANSIIKKAQQLGVNIVFPVDYQIALENIGGQLRYVDAENIPNNGIGISIGPKTVILFKEFIERAETIFFNGAMGFLSRPETQEQQNALLQTIAQFPSTSIIGGGESVAAVHQLGIQDAIAFCSTGGGATLNYLAGKDLPGLEAIFS